MKNHFKTIGVLALFFMGATSCKKAGINGDAILVVTPKHHGTVITSTALYPDSVYVKFNSKDLPADPTHDYDALFVGEAGEGHVHCAGLHTGTYFLFVTAWDPSLNARVTGGMSVKIKYKERDAEIPLDVSVTEE